MNTFRKLDENDNLLPDDAPDWVAVLQENAGLIWSRDDISVKDLTAKQADQACADFRLCGHDDWRLPTVEELFVIADRTRTHPAIDTKFFLCNSDWYWTSTPAAWSASARWIVYFCGGSSYCYDIVYRARVRAVRSVRAVSAGQ